MDRPAGLGDRAKVLWEGVTSKYALRVDELDVLRQACAEVDLIDAMFERQKSEDLIAVGSMGQPVIAPLVAEIRQHRSTLARLLAQLKLPDEDGARPPRDRSAAARRAVNVRWGND
jgi:hypothetical protein